MIGLVAVSAASLTAKEAAPARGDGWSRKVGLPMKCRGGPAPSCQPAVMRSVPKIPSPKEAAPVGDHWTVASGRLEI